MPDYSTFIKQFNVALSAPLSCAPFGFANSVAGDGGVSSTSAVAAATASSAQQQQQQEASTLARTCDATWRALLASDAAAKESSSGGSGKPLSATAMAVNTVLSSLVTAANSAGGGGGGGLSFASSSASAAGGGGALTSTTAAAMASAASPVTYPTIVIGRTTLSTEDRWRIQVQMRREEAKNGQARKEYNKKVTRAIVSTKGPSADGFAAGRGRPLRDEAAPMTATSGYARLQQQQQRRYHHRNNDNNSSGDKHNTTVNLSSDAGSPSQATLPTHAAQQHHHLVPCNTNVHAARGSLHSGEPAHANASLTALLTRASATIKRERARVAALTAQATQLRDCLAAVLRVYDEVATATTTTTATATATATTSAQATLCARDSLYRRSSNNSATARAVRNNNNNNNNSDARAAVVDVRLREHAASNVEVWRRVLAETDVVLSAHDTNNNDDDDNDSATRQRDDTARVAPTQTLSRASSSSNTSSASSLHRRADDDAAAATTTTSLSPRRVDVYRDAHDRDATLSTVVVGVPRTTTAMVTRLRRALAPPPSVSKIGDVVDAMVHALQTDVHKRLAQQEQQQQQELQPHDEAASSSCVSSMQDERCLAWPSHAPRRTFVFKRRAPCVYVLRIGSADALRARQRIDGSSRSRQRHVTHARDAAALPSCVRRALYGDDVREYVLHLSIDSGRLCVVAGGGHVDVLEYLEHAVMASFLPESALLAVAYYDYTGRYLILDTSNQSLTPPPAATPASDVDGIVDRVMLLCVMLILLLPMFLWLIYAVYAHKRTIDLELHVLEAQVVHDETKAEYDAVQREELQRRRSNVSMMSASSAAQSSFRRSNSAMSLMSQTQRSMSMPPQQQQQPYSYMPGAPYMNYGMAR